MLLVVSQVIFLLILSSLAYRGNTLAHSENPYAREVHPGTPDQRSMPISDERGCSCQNEVRDSDQSLEKETVAGPVEKDDHIH
ncbi:hypothetical protein SLEP1_g19743 [Rubroshorea leprosula]|uniref:Secreted protein n=1 Tax=Rubroshorea leprosula TaxID=152421 RepID=A0AAV5J6C5_9ROSI|nr:hypothetical protein SLEP1_g19743 [Rubroshorea leprosula]